MNGEELVEAVREEGGTELDRLGSEKSLIAATGAELEMETVLSAAARLLDGAADAFEGWAEDEPDGAAREAFAEAAAAAATQRDDLLECGEDASADGDPPLVVEYLDGLAGTPERVGAGLVAYPLVAERQFLQVINFFVNEGDTTRADTARNVRNALEGTPDDAATLLDLVCEEETEWQRAREAANHAVGIAYDEYADRLEAMGLDPKPVC